MPPTIHKILHHGYQIIQAMPLPVGLFTEQSAESQNKCYRFIREFLTRKSSRENTMDDLMSRLFVASDPIVAQQNVTNKSYSRKKDVYPQEVMDMLKGSFVEHDNEENDVDEPSDIDENFQGVEEPMTMTHELDLLEELGIGEG